MNFRPYISIAVLVPAIGLSAQDSALQSSDTTLSIVSEINASGNIRVEQPEALAALLKKRTEPGIGEEEAQQHDTRATNARSGYRIQVFDDNNPRTARSQAEARHSQVQSLFPHMRAYVTFNSPYWRVKVGDFRTRAEAEAAMAELRHAFPSMAAYMRIVRDKINTFD